MKLIIVVALALVAAVLAAPVEEPVAIIRSDFNQEPEGGFQYAVETANGIKVEAVGELKEALDEDKKPHKVVVFRGSYSYLGENGKPVVIIYVANEDGYYPEGDSIPKPASRRKTVKLSSSL